MVQNRKPVIWGMHVRQPKLQSYLIAAATVLFFILLVSQRSFYGVPAFDFFNFPRDGRAFLSLTAPPLIQDAPVYSMLLVLLARAVHGPYPEIASGVFINIVSVTLLLYCLWVLMQNYPDGVAAAVMALTATNPLSFYVALQPLNTALFTVLVLCIYFMNRGKHRTMAYVAASLSYFVRYEGIALVASMLLSEALEKNGTKKRLWVTGAFSALPAVFWEVIVYVANPRHNPYLNEIGLWVRSLPNMGFFFHTFVTAPAIGFGQFTFIVGAAIFACAIYGFVLLYHAKPEMRMMVWFVLFYTIIHMMFPGDAKRYAYPVLWIIYAAAVFGLFGILGQTKFRAAAIGAIIVLVGVNALAVAPYLSVEKDKGKELRVLGEWLSRFGTTGKTLVIARNTHVVSYFTKNPDIEFYDFFRYHCDMPCAVARYRHERDYDVLVVDDTFIPVHPIERQSADFEMKKIGELIASDDVLLTPVATIDEKSGRFTVSRVEAKSL